MMSSLLLLLSLVPSSAVIPSLSTCPTTVETLTPALLQDLPSYANRVSQRASTNSRAPNRPGYVLLAGQPDFRPLPLVSQEVEPEANDETIDQVFFTTLDRQYVEGRSVELQHYHWLFLTQTAKGWQVAMMFSTLGTYPTNQPPTPPQDSSQGVIAQAIRLWLRDCQAGTVRQN